MDRVDLPDVGLPPTQSERSLQTTSDNGSSFASLRVPPVMMMYDDGTFHHEGSVASSVDDFSVRTHDQLPAIESYKATQHGTMPKNDKNRRLKIMLAAALTIVLVTVLISIGVVIGRKETHGKGSAAQQSSGKDAPKPLEPGRIARVHEMVAFVSVDAGWSSIATMQNTTSPQYRAAEWIADYDPENLFLENNEELRTRYALAVFYYAMSGDLWNFKINWMTSQHVCFWKADWPGVSGIPKKVGVTCDEQTNTVTKLFLPSMNLVGVIPPEIRLLTGLLEIDLYNNDVAGEIPKEFIQLTDLTSLLLRDNVLTGSIPAWFTSLPKLEAIDLGVNRLTGGLPANLGEVPALQTLNLENNDLTGSLTPLLHLKTIEFLALGDNKFSGSLGEELLTSWPVIKELDLSGNQLTGGLPDMLFGMDHLMIIDLHGNQFDGRLPSIFESDSAVEFLALHENKFSGTIPKGIVALTNLRHLDLSSNNFEGSLPMEIGELVKLKYLFLAFNPMLTPGPIPFQWASLSELVDLSLQGTNRNGTIPGEMGLLRKLVLLDLAGNMLTGRIPEELGGLSKLTFLILKENKLSGEIPASLVTLENLDTIVVDDNNLTGGTANICPLKLASLRVFVADCLEIGCKCCTQCCKDVDTACNNVTWFSPQDPVASYQYTRVGYRFNENDVIYPLPGSENVTDYYDTFGIPGGI